MKEYVFSLVCVSLIAALFTLLCPEDATLQKGFRFVLVLVIMCAVFLPSESVKAILDGSYAENFEGLFGSQDEEFDASHFADSFEKYGAQYVNAQIKKDICAVFNIADSDCRIVSSFGMKDGGLYFEKITIMISGKAVWKDPHAMEDHITENYGCKCDVALE